MVGRQVGGREWEEDGGWFYVRKNSTRTTQVIPTVAADKNTKLSISWFIINIGTVTFCVDIILELLYLTLFSNSCAPT